MTEKIGPPHGGVRYPVWAWYKQDGKNHKPDLRREQWSYGSGDEEYVCIELDIPDHLVVLLDYHSWNLVLMDALITENEARREAWQIKKRMTTNYAPGSET